MLLNTTCNAKYHYGWLEDKWAATVTVLYQILFVIIFASPPMLGLPRQRNTYDTELIFVFSSPCSMPCPDSTMHVLSGANIVKL
jgi:hypothetical protein